MYVFEAVLRAPPPAIQWVEAARNEFCGAPHSFLFPEFNLPQLI